MKITMKVWLVLALLVLSGCASNTAQQQAQDNGDPNDPIEGFNRTMWSFNYDFLDKYVVRPATVLYVDIMPMPARKGLLNMANNLEEPGNTVNNLLQGKVGDSMVSLGRFALNSTVGLLGTIDVASEIGLTVKRERGGETIGSYGVNTGPYVMLPFWGPTDPRSAVGDYADNSYFPLGDLNFYVALARFGIQALESRAILMQQEQQLNTSLDPYTFVKEAYFQNLEFRVKDGQIETSEEELEMDDEIDDYLDDI